MSKVARETRWLEARADRAEPGMWARWDEGPDDKAAWAPEDVRSVYGIVLEFDGDPPGSYLLRSVDGTEVRIREGDTDADLQLLDEDDEVAYCGQRRPVTGEVSIRVRSADGQEWPLKHHPRHSPDGFEWGYGGSGPAELARCVLIDYFDLHDEAQRDRDLNPPVSYQDFKSDVIAAMPQSRDWVLTHRQIARWVDAWRAAQT